MDCALGFYYWGVASGYRSRAATEVMKALNEIDEEIIKCAVKPLALAMGISGEGLSSPSYTLGAILRMCSPFDKWRHWRLSQAIVGNVKCIASSRPDVNRIRRTKVVSEV
jgi:hypothetical protein